MQKTSYVKQLVICGLLAAMYGILAGPLSFYAFTWKISFAFVPICIASISYGPIYGGLTGLTGDLISVLLIQRNPFNPLFTLTAILTGVLPWLVFKLVRGNIKKPSMLQIFLPVCITVLFCSFFLNTTWMVLFFGQTPALYFTRLGVNAVMIPLHTTIIYLLFKTVFSKVNLY